MFCYVYPAVYIVFSTSGDIHYVGLYSTHPIGGYSVHQEYPKYIKGVQYI